MARPRIHILSMLLFGALVASCDPQFPSDGDVFGTGDGYHPDDNGGQGDNDQGDSCTDAIPSGQYAFSVSASSTDPFVNSAAAPSGPLDLFVWLVQADSGLSAAEFDIEREGVELQSNYFTPAGDNLFLTWEGSGEVDLAVAGCPHNPTLLGTLHLVTTGDSVHVSIIQDSEWGGAVDCGPCYLLHDFSCIPFASE